MFNTRKYRVALVGYYGFGNLGDELLLEASINALERCGLTRHKDLIVLSNDPKDTTRKFNVPSISRWKIRDVWQALAKSESLLLGGGGLFQDSTSLRSCVWYWGLVKMARLCGARPWAIGQSIGPLNSRFARWLTRNALKDCQVLHVRDKPSQELALNFKLERECNIISGSDLALTLDLAHGAYKSNLKHESREKKLLVNLRPCGATQLEQFVNRAVEFCKRNDYNNIVGVAFSPEDQAFMQDLSTSKGLNFSRIVPVRTRDEIEPIWHGAEAAIGMRLHFAVISTLFKIPLATLPYDPKVNAFSLWIGLDGSKENLTPQVPTLPVTTETVRDEIDAICLQMLEISRNSI